MGGQAGTSQNESGLSSHSLCFFQSEDALERFQQALMEMSPLKAAVVRWAEKKMKHQRRTNCQSTLTSEATRYSSLWSSS